MMRAAVHWVRIYLAEAWLGYHGRFALTSPFGYLAGKFGFPFFLMLFFIYLGKARGLCRPAVHRDRQHAADCDAFADQIRRRAA
jgi:hypothetical protein